MTENLIVGVCAIPFICDNLIAQCDPSCRIFKKLRALNANRHTHIVQDAPIPRRHATADHYYN